MPRISTVSPADKLVSGGYCEPGPCRTESCRRVEAIGVAGVGVSVGLGVSVEVGVCDGVTVGVFDGVRVTVLVAVGRSVGVDVEVLVAVGSLVSVGDGAAVSLGLGVSEADTITEAEVADGSTDWDSGVLEAVSLVDVGTSVAGWLVALEDGVSEAETTTAAEVSVSLTALGVTSVVPPLLPREANSTINPMTTTAATTPNTANPVRRPPDGACPAPPS